MNLELRLVHLIPVVKDHLYFSRYICHLFMDAPPKTRPDKVHILAHDCSKH